ncbi:MAG: hypothetical protein JSV27_01190 [Candidatus Bathyarchaeota archaeon]|nr:MAG: hypothetical protein JSV27_01190 [Candidatus Bathyarchaeota archaeon]
MSPYANLLLQVLMVVGLTVGIYLVRRLRFGGHGYVMLVIVALNVYSIGSVMLPSARNILSGAKFDSFTLLVAAHSVAGLMVELTGMYVVYVWRLRPPGQSCFRLGRPMKVLAAAWLIIAVLGAYIYFLLYT